MHSLKLFTQRIGIIVFTQCLIALSGILLIPIITQNLAIEDYGVWSQFLVTIELFTGIIVLGLPYGMVRFLAASKQREEIQEGFYSIVIIIFVTSLLSCLILLICSSFFAQLFFDNNKPIVVILVFVIFIECFNLLFSNYFRTFQKIKYFSFFALLKCYSNFGIIAYLVYSGFGLNGCAIGYLVTDILVCLMMIIVIITEIGFRFPNFSHIKEYLSFSLPTIPSNFSSWIITSSNRYFISIIIGISFVGYFTPAYQLGNMINFFINPFTYLLPAALSKLYDEEKLFEAKILIKYTFKYYMILAIPSVIGISILGKSLLLLLSTREIANNGYLVIPFIAGSAVFYGAFVIIVQILVLKKKTGVTAGIWIFVAIISFVLNFLFIPFFGIIGAAFSILLTYFSMLLITTYLSYKEFQFEIDIPSIIKAIFSSFLMSLIILIWNPMGIFNTGIYIITSAIIYFSCLYFLGGFPKKEINFMRDILRSRS